MPINNGKLSEVTVCSRQISGARGLLRRKRPNLFQSAFYGNVGTVWFWRPIVTKVVPATFAISHIFRVRTLAKVINDVVHSITVNVINHTFRPCAVIMEPSKSVSQILLAKSSKSPVSALRFISGLVARLCPLRHTLEPCELT